MAHLIGKDIYRQLGSTLDQTPVRMPWSEAMRDMLQALYSQDEAELIVRMPYRPSSLQRVASVTRMETKQLEPMLHSMCHKGLVCDIWENDRYLYMISPFVIGFFEFSMMRTKGELDSKKWAELFHAYMFGSKDFMEANFGDDQIISIMRAMPHEETLGEHVEILDYEKASALIAEQDVFAVSLCSCRHEKMHMGEQKCGIPLDTCTSMGGAAEFLLRNELARESSKAEMLDILARSREMGFTLTTDNVKQDAGFICHCCGCCCNLMNGIKHSGYQGIVVSSSFIAQCDSAECIGCGLCAKACPIDAITMLDLPPLAGKTDKRKRKLAVIDSELCLGCGVCALKCKPGALQLVEREQKVFHPEDSFERVLLQSLERGTLQNLIFDNPNNKAQGFMRSLLGGFLKLSPVKKGLMSETLRSRFLSAIRAASGS